MLKHGLDRHAVLGGVSTAHPHPGPRAPARPAYYQ
jgi:hypothetical protein